MFGIDRRKNSAGVLTPAGNTLGKRISSTRMNTIFGWLWVLLAAPRGLFEGPEIGQQAAGHHRAALRQKLSAVHICCERTSALIMGERSGHRL